MAITEQRVEEMEMLVRDLGEQVRRNHVILNGDPNVAFSSGVLWRLQQIESNFAKQAQLIQGLTTSIEKQNQLRERERAITEAKEQERTEIFIRIEKWIKILGPLLGGGLSLQVIFEIIKALNGG